MYKTTFVTHNGLYRYIRIPFGLKNALATFLRAMAIISRQVNRQHTLVYFNDVVKLSETSEEHINNVESVFRLINKAEMALKL